MGLWAIKYADIDDKWWVDVVLQEAPPAVSRQEVGGRIMIPKPELQKYYEEHKNEFVREEQTTFLARAA